MEEILGKRGQIWYRDEAAWYFKNVQFGMQQVYTVYKIIIIIIMVNNNNKGWRCKDLLIK